MTIPGKPKFGVVSVGHADNHGGNGYKCAVIDDYPIKFGLRARPAAQVAPTQPRRWRLFGEKG